MRILKHAKQSPSSNASIGTDATTSTSMYLPTSSLPDKEFYKLNSNTKTISLPSPSAATTTTVSETISLPSNTSFSIQNNEPRVNQNKGQSTFRKEIIKSMLKQECTSYKCTDYLYSSQPRKILIHPRKESEIPKASPDSEVMSHHSPKSLASIHTATSSQSNTSTLTSSVGESLSLSSYSSSYKKRRLADVSCRQKICEWAYRIINFFNIDRETVYYCVSYLDRFMMHYKTDRHTYKLLATTMLFLALKVHQPRKLILKNAVHDLSKGEFDMKDIDRMELIVLGTLGWSLHPPTPMSFVVRLIDMQQYLIQVLNQNFPNQFLNVDGNDDHGVFFDVEKVQAHAIFFVELSLFDYSFVSQKQSKVALAAILNTIEGLGLFEAVSLSDSKQTKRLFYGILSSIFELVNVDIIDLEMDDHGLLSIRNKLWDLYENSEETSSSQASPSFRRRQECIDLEEISNAMGR